MDKKAARLRRAKRARSAIALPTTAAAATLPVLPSISPATDLSTVEAAAITSEPLGAITWA